PSAGREQSRGTDHSDLGMSSWTDRMPPLGKKRTGFGPHPESEHPGQMRLECRSRTAISCDSHESREEHFRRPAEEAGRVCSPTLQNKLTGFGPQPHTTDPAMSGAETRSRNTFL